LLPSMLFMRAITEDNGHVPACMVRETGPKDTKEHFMSKIESILKELSAPYTFNNLQMLLSAAGLEYTLQGNRPLTLFAPHDGVFEELQQRTAYDLLTDITKLNRLLCHHIVPLKLGSAELRAEAAEQTNVPGQAAQSGEKSVLLPTEAEGDTLHVSIDDTIQVEGVRVVLPDIEADNGVIHVIENILWPPGLSVISFGERSPVNAPGRKEKP
jgi:uncharacterized surface protein with fasciclin (FAS1) repeats